MATSLILDTPSASKKRKTDSQINKCSFSIDSLKELIKIVETLRLVRYWSLTYELLQNNHKIKDIWNKNNTIIKNILKIKQRPIAQTYLNLKHLPR
eukprot:587638_1